MSTPCLMSGHHLLEQLEQLPYFAKLDEGEVGDVAAWTRQTRDKAAAKWGLVGMTDVASFAAAAPVRKMTPTMSRTSSVVIR